MLLRVTSYFVVLWKCMHSTQYCIDRRTHATKSNEKLENSLVNNMYARAARVFAKKKKEKHNGTLDSRAVGECGMRCNTEKMPIRLCAMQVSEWVSVCINSVQSHRKTLSTFGYFSFSNGLLFNRFSPAQNYSRSFWSDVGATISKSEPDAHIWCVHVSSFYFLHIFQFSVAWIASFLTLIAHSMHCNTVNCSQCVFVIFQWSAIVAIDVFYVSPFPPLSCPIVCETASVFVCVYLCVWFNFNIFSVYFSWLRFGSFVAKVFFPSCSMFCFQSYTRFGFGRGKSLSLFSDYDGGATEQTIILRKHTIIVEYQFSQLFSNYILPIFILFFHHIVRLGYFAFGFHSHFWRNKKCLVLLKIECSFVVIAVFASFIYSFWKLILPDQFRTHAEVKIKSAFGKTFVVSERIKKNVSNLF